MPAFLTNEYRLYLKEMEDSVKKYLADRSNKQILSADYQTMKQEIFKIFSKEPISITSTESKVLKKPEKPIEGIIDANYDFDEKWEGYIFNEIFYCGGSIEMLQYRPTEYLMKELNFHNLSSVRLGVIQVKIYMDKNLDPVEFERKKTIAQKFIRVNIQNLNAEIGKSNDRINEVFDRYYLIKRQEVEKEESFFKTFALNINRETDSLIKTVNVKIKESPKPIETKNHRKTALVIPVVSEAFYEDVIRVINQFYKSVEKRPSIYAPKDEEALRDYIIPTLELRYQNSSVTSETFNKTGRTDILLKAESGDVLFVAEFKFWHGQSELIKALDQLFGYMTIRETKSALIVFVKNKKDFSSILAKINETITTRANYLKTLKAQSDSSITYRFYLPADRGTEISLTVTAFFFEAVI
jgi:hypothetical protein